MRLDFGFIIVRERSLYYVFTILAGENHHSSRGAPVLFIRSGGMCALAYVFNIFVIRRQARK